MGRSRKPAYDVSCRLALIRDEIVDVGDDFDHGRLA